MTSSKKFTAVIYFHGMGSQRRYEETSRLIDALDTYLSNQPGQSLGIIREIEPRLEALRGGKGETVDYIHTRHITNVAGQNVRFYESYWAPIMADTRSAKDVALWALGQAVRPALTFRTPWRERQRLRRSALSDLFDKPHKWPKDTTAEDFSDILGAYSRYNKLSVKRQEVSAELEGFKSFLETEFDKRPDRDDLIKRLKPLADAWSDHYRKTEYKNAFFIATILLALILAAGGAIWYLFQFFLFVAAVIPTLDLPKPLADAAAEWKTPGVLGAASMLPGILLTLGAGKFLSNSLGDVQAWSTLDETDAAHEKREKVLIASCKLIDHVLKDPNCTRAVVVSHSLGTSVAHDTLLRLGWKNSADGHSAPIVGPPDLRKIRQVVTMGSPVDKIHYFFESTRSDSHRYMRVIDKVRGDISTAPFANNRHPHIHWVNYWDEADVISGALHSDTGEETIEHGVDNVHVQNRRFPNPAKAHIDYIGNRSVIGGIFEMAYENKHSYGSLKWQQGQQGLDYASMALKPGDALGRYRIWQALALLLPWVLATGLVTRFLDLRPFSDWLLYGSAAAAVALILGWFIDRTRGNKSPL